MAEYITLDSYLEDFDTEHVRKTDCGVIAAYHCPYPKVFPADSVFCFDLLMHGLRGADGFALRGQTPQVMHGTMYEILFDEAYILVTKYVEDQEFPFFGPKGCFGMLPNHFVGWEKRHSIETGAVDTQGGVRLFLKVDGRTVFDIVDDKEPIRGNGYFIVQAEGNPMNLLPFTGIGRTDGELHLNLPKHAAYPYSERIREYLTEEDSTRWLSDYIGGSYLEPIRISWETTLRDVERYILSYGRKADYSDAVILELDGGRTDCELYNLYKRAVYYCKLTAYTAAGKEVSEEGKFRTTGIGPRLIRLEGAYNMRDLGGYIVYSGKKVAQGLLYRSALLGTRRPDGSGLVLTENDILCLTRELGIRTELELRTLKETGIYEESLIPGAKLVRHPIDSYKDGLVDSAEALREIFALLAGRDNYPLCFHCAGGADRTALLAYLVEALLGVSDRERLHDFEYTSFSPCGFHSSREGLFEKLYGEMEDFLDGFDGEDPSARTESYLLSIGVTKGEIASIREILLEDDNCGKN